MFVEHPSFSSVAVSPSIVGVNSQPAGRSIIHYSYYQQCTVIIRITAIISIIITIIVVIIDIKKERERKKTIVVTCRYLD